MSALENAEQQRLDAYGRRDSNWKHWGPYLSERAWGTVREDYSAHGAAWDFFPHDHARSRAYRWNEDGLAGVSDRAQYLCLAGALWNGQDPILKERLFGLTGSEGNHGEDVKELYFYLDSTPTHSYMKMLYKYPQAAYPYADLVVENNRRGYDAAEYELLDTGVFAANRYFDVVFEYAKADENDLFLRITAHNRGPEAAPLTLLPTLWFRNTWSWGYPGGPMGDVDGRPRLQQIKQGAAAFVEAEHPALGRTYFYADGADRLLFTENESNNERLFGAANASPFVKDAFHRYVVEREREAVNPQRTGTKAAALFARQVPAGGSVTVQVRLSAAPQETPFAAADDTFAARLAEADAFYAALQPQRLSADERAVQRQAFAGLLWSKQLYYYDVVQWLSGDPDQPPPPRQRRQGRNHKWEHLVNFDLISMPDKWEYPWYATWDLAFHCLPLVLVDPDFAKRQLVLLTREWYMDPNGQLPAYEWALGDANPPVHAWAAWRVYKIDAARSGRADRPFLERIFHKLLLNFTWWVNRKDEDGRNVFQGGFLGLDNISVFDRSSALPTGGHIDQADGTAWMAAYCLQLMKIALELAREDPVYQDLATKLFEHFLRIAYAMTHIGGSDYALWDEEDGFFYDALHLPDGPIVPLKVRSLVGLLPLIAVETIEPDWLAQMPVFARRVEWFLHNRPQFNQNVACYRHDGVGERRLLSLLTEDNLRRVLAVMLDEEEFLSPYGIRSLSKVHGERPYAFDVEGRTHTVPYWPGESRSGLFGGNSNWRGPVWFPVNFLLIEALQKYHHFYGDAFQVEFPTGSGNRVTLDVVARDLSRRLTALFLRDEKGRRPAHGGGPFAEDPHWRDLVLFYEYFHGDSGAGHGASHQTGWTGLVAKLIQQSGGTGPVMGTDDV